MVKQKTGVKKSWENWRYKNTAFLILSLILLYYLAKTPLVDTLIRQVGDMGYVGAFVTGIFFVSTFTVAPAVIVLFKLADVLHPVEVALLAGMGAMAGDFIIFRFVKDKVFEELAPLFRKLHTAKTRRLFKTPYFAWFMPVIGAFLIASPFPDEIGVSMLGLSKIRPWQFFLVTFALNAVGIFIVVTVARL
jgi:uncharacterized membrane protein YdjX (TVP38/TMEM64 family)